ncbi:MetQ/NlpA family ABC transporter substrate-binding protein [Cellulosilyticum ruminicola]|uniref:MetQ/NlpA family ABC transporter substrate-binding protein n=1 Tax=Cellulosilyticum ruminicola TaxID=425254 RepID=UPI0006CFC20C|nr:MetQ/NlpA family ABC transporter substrate-binding protein [Cellulosilyticum ruminicola]
MRKSLIYKLSLLAVVGFGILTGCGSQNASGEDVKDVAASVNEVRAKDTIKFGTCPGPYGDMIQYAIKPGLEEKGYKVDIIEFSDYVQPNLALGKGEVDANMFQHSVYLENFKTEHNLELSNLINIPTAGLGIYSDKYTDISNIPEGASLTVPNDVTNLRRALKEAQNAGLLTIDETTDVTSFSEKNVKDNPLNLVITPVEAAQLPRTLQSSDLAAIPGNYALSAGIDLDSAIYKEVLAEEMKNVIAVQTKDLDSQFVKDIVEVVESEDFKDVIESSDYAFSSFQKPDWYTEKWK